MALGYAGFSSKIMLLKLVTEIIQVGVYCNVIVGIFFVACITALLIVLSYSRPEKSQVHSL